MSFYNLMTYLGIALLLINTIIYFKSYRKFSIAFKFFSYYLLIILVIQITTRYYFIKKDNNIFLSHYYFIGQFILLSIFFKNILNKNSQKKIISIVLITVLIILGIYYGMNPSYYFKFNTFEIVITSVPLIVYCFFFFIQKIEDSDKKFIYIASGFFLYILCSTLLFTTGNIEASIKKIIWQLNSVLYIIYQVLVFVEWYKHFRKKPSILINKE